MISKLIKQFAIKWVKNITRAILILWVFCISCNAAEFRYKDIKILDQSNTVNTVMGSISPDELGQTLMHEHLFIKFYLPLDQIKRWKMIGAVPPKTKKELEIWNEPFTVQNSSRLTYMHNRDKSILNQSDVIEEVLAYKVLGGTTIVDTTPGGGTLGREPKLLRRMARDTGINIVMGTGFYREAWHPLEIDKWTLDDLTAYMVKEITIGADDTGIKAGIIGEIPVQSLSFRPDSNEVRVLRASARASRLTGAAISIHNDGFAIPSKKNNPHVGLDLLEEEGADLTRVVMGHVSGKGASDIGFLESLLRRGVYLQFDLLGGAIYAGSNTYNNPDVDSIITLINRGYADRLLVSHDIHWKTHLRKYGGHGLTFVHQHLIPYLLDKGIYQHQIEQILIENPRRVLTFVKPRAHVLKSQD